MKLFNFFAATSTWGCFLTFLCADFVLAGSVPVGSLSGVTRLTPVTVTPNVTTAAPVTVTPNVTTAAPVTVSPNVTITTPVTVSPNVTITTPVTVSPNVTTAAPVTRVQVGQSTLAQLASGAGVTVTATSMTLSISAATPTVNNQVSRMVTLVPVDGQPSQFSLEGTSGQVANASAFLAVATADEFNPSQIQLGTIIALTGAEYTQVAALMDILPAVFILSSNKELIISGEDNKFQVVPISKVDRQTLNTAIIIYNAILDSSDDVTVVALSANEDFLAIGSGLRQLRSAIDVL